MTFVELTCETCGCKFLRGRAEYRRQAAKGRRVFCSMKCLGANNPSNANRPKTREFVTLTCGSCECQFTRRKKYWSNKRTYGQVIFYCSPECSQRAKTKLTDRGCHNCQKPYSCSRWGRYCSPECVADWKQKNKKGDGRGRLDEFASFRPHLAKIHQHSARKGNEVVITLNDLKDQWNNQNGLCPYTGQPMVLRRSRAERGSATPYTASVDRIDSTKGYVKDNIEFVCLMAQYAKNAFSKEDVIEFCNKVAIFNRGEQCQD